MRVKVIFNNQEFISKEMAETDVEAFSEKLCEDINKFTEMKLETDFGFVVFPKYIVERSIIVIMETI